MALTNEQVREILSAAGVDEDHMKTAAEKIISGHLESVNALRLDVEKYRSDSEKLPGVSQELETLKKSSGDAADIQKQLTDLQAKYDKDAKIGTLAAGLFPIRTATALHAGDLLVGVFDDGVRAEYTVLGPAMNMLARIEARAKAADLAVAASADFVALLTFMYLSCL